MKECTIYNLFINNIDGYNNYFGVEENGVMRELVTGKIVYEANPSSMPPMPQFLITPRTRWHFQPQTFQGAATSICLPGVRR